MVKVLFEALKRYFNQLTHTGYVSYNKVNKLLVLSIIYDVFEIFKCDITSEDYAIIEKALVCLYGSNCLIPYPKYNNNPYVDSLFKLNTAEQACS